MNDLLSELRSIVGERHVLADPDLRAGYETDWTGRWHGESLAVVRPADTRQVSAVLCAIGTVWMARLAVRIYANSILRTGPRISFRQAIRESRNASAATHAANSGACFRPMPC